MTVENSEISSHVWGKQPHESGLEWEVHDANDDEGSNTTVEVVSY
jgi:hypothetical protein